VLVVDQYAVQKLSQQGGIAISNGNYIQIDILCVSENDPKQEAKPETHKNTNGPCWWVREATKLHAETKDPRSQDSKDHKGIPRHSEANIDNAESQWE